VIGNPVEDGVGQQDIDRLVRLPVPLIAEAELPMLHPSVGLGMLEHLGRPADAQDVGLGPASRQQGGDAGTAAQVDHMTRGLHRNAVQQFEKGAPPLVGVALVLAGNPHRLVPHRLITKDAAVSRL
jgi:hypothetical protein